MKFTIHTGQHRAHPAILGIWYNKKTLQKDVYFDRTCKYEIPGEDMNDTNKLFGIGYFWSHHKNSIRFGWRYNPESDKIMISGYCYDKGERIINNICEVDLYRLTRFSIFVSEKQYSLEVSDAHNSWYKLGSILISKSHNRKWSYPLGLYFGGQATAPKPIEILMKNP